MARVGPQHPRNIYIYIYIYIYISTALWLGLTSRRVSTNNRLFIILPILSIAPQKRVTMNIIPKEGAAS